MPPLEGTRTCFNFSWRCSFLSLSLSLFHSLPSSCCFSLSCSPSICVSFSDSSARHNFSSLTWNWLISFKRRRCLSCCAVDVAARCTYKCLPVNCAAGCLARSPCTFVWRRRLQVTPSGQRQTDRGTDEGIERTTALPAHWWNWLFMLSSLTSFRFCVVLAAPSPSAPPSLSTSTSASASASVPNWNWIFGIKFLFTLRCFLVCLYASRKSVRCARSRSATSATTRTITKAITEAIITTKDRQQQ